MQKELTRKMNLEKFGVKLKLQGLNAMEDSKIVEESY